MKRISKWTAVALIVVGSVGLALNFSDLLASGIKIDRTAEIAPNHVQQAGSSASASAVVDDSAVEDGRWKEIRKRWEFKSGAFQQFSLSSSDHVHIEVKTDADTDYLEVRGVVSPEAADRAFQTNGDTDGIKLDLTAPEQIRLLTIGSDNKDLYVTLGLRDARQLEDADFSIGSGMAEFGDFYSARLSIDLSSGELKADRLSSDDMVLKLTSGSANINELFAPSEIGLSSGMLKIASLQGDSVVKATSGIVNLTQTRSSNLDVEVSSGTVDIRAAEDFKGIYDLNVTSGLINAPDSPGTEGDTIKVRATSGIITIKP